VTAYSPIVRTKHKHKRPPVVGGFDLLTAATPTLPLGTVWACYCGQAFWWAHRFAPLLPGWDRIPAWLGRRIAARRTSASKEPTNG